jgi:hypothetical protein
MLRAQGRWTYADLEPIGYLNSDALTWVGPTEEAIDLLYVLAVFATYPCSGPLEGRLCGVRARPSRG